MSLDENILGYLLNGAFLLGAYLLGSVPCGLLIARVLAGLDVRQHGSGNIGATNVMRSAGLGAGLATLLLDAGKGLLPTLLARASCQPPSWAAWVGLSAILGHTSSVFLRGRGGKGVATALGVYLGLCPTAVGLSAALFLVLVLLTRMVSVGSIVAAVALPPFAALLGSPWPILVSCALGAMVIVLKHRKNISRIIAGTESRLWGAAAGGEGGAR